MSSKARRAQTYRGFRRNDWHYRYSKTDGLPWSMFYYSHHHANEAYIPQTGRGSWHKAQWHGPVAELVI